MKVIEVTSCQDCPHCQFYDGWNSQENVWVCNELDKIISIQPFDVDPACPLEDR